MSVFSRLKSMITIKKQYSWHRDPCPEDNWKPHVFDYAPESYSKNYPRNYPMTSYAQMMDGALFHNWIVDAGDFVIEDDVTRIIFTDSEFPPHDEYAQIDVSLYEDNSIKAWNQTVGEDFCLIISSGEKGKGIALNRSTNYMFADFKSLKSIEWNNVASTKDTISMRQMFSGCCKLEYLDLSSWDVSNVKSMSGMFVECKKLKKIEWFKFNTSKVEDVSYMFTNCHSLRDVNLSGFDTSSLLTCKKMFKRCGVEKVNLGHWYPTSPIKELNVEDMFHTTGLLSVLVTNNPIVQELYLNPPDEETRDCLEENNIPRQLVSEEEWHVSVYNWEKS